MIAIPPDLVHTITATYPQKGQHWLETLPTLIADCARRWRLTVEEPFTNLSYSFVAPARRVDGTLSVLKIGILNAEWSTAIEALRLFEGRGAVKLLAVDDEHGAVLLERALPGKPLAALDDDREATLIAAMVMQRLWCIPPKKHAFPSIADWAASLNKYHAYAVGAAGLLPAPLVSKAEGLMTDLLSSSPEPMLLHGDVHHFNIVSAGRARWVAIDPKGVIGEPAYETARFLHNPPQVLTQPHADRLVRQRMDIMSDVLGLDRQRVWAWGFCNTILSAWWGIEDGNKDWAAYCITCAELMDAMV